MRRGAAVALAAFLACAAVAQETPPGDDGGREAEAGRPGSAGSAASSPVQGDTGSGGQEDTGSAAAGPQGADAEVLLQQALELRGAGRLPEAAEVLRRAMSVAGDDAGLKSRIHRELYFHLPVLEAQRLLLLSQPARARRVVEQALEYNRGHAAEAQQLREFLRNIRRLEAQDASETEGGTVLREVGNRLAAFRAREGRYPAGYAELNRLLPAEQPPLEYFDIVHYSAGTDTFTLRLRSRLDPERTLTLHQTGLLR